jgi:hypothetical protein
MTLVQVRAYALSLPEVTEEPHFDRTSFRVRGKILATARTGESHIHIFVDALERDQAVAAYPDHMHKLWWGKQVRGLRVSLKAPTVAVKELLRKAWVAKAPASPAKATRRKARPGVRD